MKTIALLLTGVLLGTGFGPARAANAAASAANNPNLVYILADDLGYGDVHWARR